MIPHSPLTMFFQEKRADAVRRIFIFFLVACCLLPAARSARAQSSVALSVTPPLFQLTVKPGETWSSALKIINTNPSELTVYAVVSDFQAEGEEGHGKFIPVAGALPEGAPGTLARWIEISSEPTVIPVQQSREIPFTVRVPEYAEPGGHYAAILVGTQPGGGGEGNQIRISSFVTSLLFLRISGDVREEGYIREFAPEKDFYQEPDVAFTVRFENAGNVHLQPQGDITIYNMWGRQRGVIPVNQRSEFGNVLPGSVRKFVFAWNGEKSFFESGKYKAVATLSFGAEARQNVSATSYFWVVPLKPTLGLLGGVIAGILGIAWALRRYVRKVLELEAERRGLALPPPPAAPIRRTFAQPEIIRNGKKTPDPVAASSAARWKFWSKPPQARSYALLVLCIIFIGALCAVFYFQATLIPARTYEVFIQHENGQRIRVRLNGN